MADASIAALGPRHFVQCPHGARCPSTVHDPLVRALTAVLDAVFGPARVLAERASGRGPIDAFMAGPGASLLHRPDIVVLGMHGRGTYTIIDVKSFDATGPTHVTSHATDRRRGAAHTAIALATRVSYGPLPAGMCLVPFVVSVTGAMGRHALTFVRELAMRSPTSLPFSLLDQASWAVPTLAPFLRCVVSTSVRRSVGLYHTRWWGYV